MPDAAQIIAILAALGSVASFVPQLAKVFRDRDAAGVSPLMYLIAVGTFTLWTAYGVLSEAWILAASNVLCFLLTLAILITTLVRRSANPAAGRRD